MSTPLRVSRGAVEKFRRYNEELPSQRIVVLGAEPSIRKPSSPSWSDITAENICNEKSLLATRVEESFLSGINFFIVLISSVSTNFATEHLVSVLAFFSTFVVSLLDPPLRYRSVSFS